MTLKSNPRYHIYAHTFRCRLYEECNTHLLPQIDFNKYYRSVLDDIGEDGELYHEIRGIHTVSGNPVVITAL